MRGSHLHVSVAHRSFSGGDIRRVIFGAVADSIHIASGLPKELAYEQLLPQIYALIEGERDEVAVLANTAAALHETFHTLWTGFYLVKDNELVLGPFQGPVACNRISFGKGVCGSAWEKGESIVVPDVDRFPGHIACSSQSRSEIVVPIRKDKGEVLGVLDVDSSTLNSFDEVDRTYLEKLCKHLGQIIG